MSNYDIPFDHNDLIQPKPDSKYTNFEEANSRSWAEAIDPKRLRLLSHEAWVEALADTVPKAKYDKAVRRLAAYAELIADQEPGPNYGPPKYENLCIEYGVDPEGGDK
jgi:hypothetical protein